MGTVLGRGGEVSYGCVGGGLVVMGGAIEERESKGGIWNNVSVSPPQGGCTDWGSGLQYCSVFSSNHACSVSLLYCSLLLLYPALHGIKFEFLLFVNCKFGLPLPLDKLHV